MTPTVEMIGDFEAITDLAKTYTQQLGMSSQVDLVLLVYIDSGTTPAHT